MFYLNCKGTLFNLNRPVVMGIINCTPDSFYAGNRFLGEDIVKVAGKHIEEGAAILDIGGQSTRPGSISITEKEELVRVTDAIKYIHEAFPDTILSVDTYYGSVAAAAIEAGAHIINDVSAGAIDTSIIDVAASYKAPYVLMHMQGTPGNMQAHPQYKDVVAEILEFFIKKTAHCRSRGIEDIIIDPGFGFGKTLAHNYTLLSGLEAFHILECPLLAGVSRKSMIQKLLGVDAAQALNGTTILNTHAIEKGAKILRVHDVREAVEVIRVWEMMKKSY